VTRAALDVRVSTREQTVANQELERPCRGG